MHLKNKIVFTFVQYRDSFYWKKKKIQNITLAKVSIMKLNTLFQTFSWSMIPSRQNLNRRKNQKNAEQNITATLPKQCTQG